MVAEEEDIGAQTPPRKRTRTGCLKCRSRRRKCDEGKPQCRNCATKSFDCKYPSGLTFLERNSYTVLPSDAAPAAAQTPRYVNLSFVSETPRKGKRSKSTDEENRHAPAEDPSVDTNGSRTASPRPVTLHLGEQSANADGNDHQTDEGTHQTSGEVVTPVDLRLAAQRNGRQSWSPQDREAVLQDIPQENALFGDRYESALHGLLALGHGQNGISSIDAEAVNPSTSAQNPHPLPGPFQASPSTEYPHGDQQPCQRDSLESPVARYYQPPTEDRALDLLRHYRYQVAPWLDIYDMDQAFGVTILRTAMQTDTTRFALLALSAISFRSCRPSKESSDLLALAHLDNVLEPGSIGLLMFLEMLCSFLSDLAGCWSQSTFFELDSFRTFQLENPCEQGTIGRSCMGSVRLRLELSIALIQFRPVTLILLDNPNADAMEGISARVSIYAQRALILCARTLNLTCGDDNVNYLAGHEAPSQRPRQTFLDRWRMLLEELDAWFRARPAEFHPAIELTSRQDAPFPTIIYTNGAAIFANQLYHTAMLLLLLNKPRTLRLSGGPSYVSPLWHAERLCGIALNNERREYWDPCLLASLLLAARRMTHESQQRALLEGFRRIQRLTGFNIEPYVSELQESWTSLGDL